MTTATPAAVFIGPPHPLDIQLDASLHGDFERGFEVVQHLEKLFPEDPRAAFNRGWYRMANGKLLEGLSLLDAGRWINVFGSPPLKTIKPIYRNEELRDKHLLLSLEGGLGDEIINVRFAKDFADRGAKVTVACDKSLMSAFAKMDGVAAVVPRDIAAQVYHDFWVPGMSAARVLNYEYEKLSGKPYLKSDRALESKWVNELMQKYSVKPKIGVRFFGNPKFEHEQFRKFPRELMMDAIGNRPWVNLQKEETDLKIESWDDTLAIINQLDLVITSCTSVAHASAALGKETWVLTPILPYYIWALPGDKSPWYKSVRLFRQKKFNDWTETFADLKAALDERLPAKN